MVIYETINKINGKRYIGKDRNNDPKYYGSGTLLKKAIKKYGKENFVKTIIEECTNETHLNERERHWINITNAQVSRQYYNVGEGGLGGDNHTHRTKEEYNKFVEKMKIINSTQNGMLGKSHSECTKELMKEKSKGRYSLDWFIERHGTELGTQKYNERNKRLSERDMRGANNPAYVHLDKEQIINFIKETPNCTYLQIQNKFKCGNTSLMNRFKQWFGTGRITEVRKIIFGLDSIL